MEDLKPEYDEAGLLTPESAWRLATHYLGEAQRLKRSAMAPHEACTASATLAQAYAVYATGREETSLVLELEGGEKS